MALGFLATKARSDVLTLTVPADRAAGLADAMEHMREAARGGRTAEFERLARELAANRTLTAERPLLHELLSVAIDEAGEALGVRCNRLLRGEGSPGEVRARVATLSGLLDLLERLAEEAEPSGCAAVDVDRLAGDERRGG